LQRAWFKIYSCEQRAGQALDELLMVAVRLCL